MTEPKRPGFIEKAEEALRFYLDLEKGAGRLMRMTHECAPVHGALDLLTRVSAVEVKWSRQRPTVPGLYLIRCKDVTGEVRVMSGCVYEDDADAMPIPPFYFLDLNGQHRLGTMVEADELGAEWLALSPLLGGGWLCKEEV